MVRIKIYKPLLKRVKKGKQTIVEIVKKDSEFIREITVMDRTWDDFNDLRGQEGPNGENLQDEWIYNHKTYYKEVPWEKHKEAMEKKEKAKTEKITRGSNESKGFVEKVKDLVGKK